MAITVAISPGTLIFLICLQNIMAQQCYNIGQKNPTGAHQQISTNQMTQISGLGFNSPQQASVQQMNYQQQSNIQQTPFTQQTGNLPQQNLQSPCSQQSVNSNSQAQNQNLASNIFSALGSIRQSSRNQGTNVVSTKSQQTNCCGSKQIGQILTPSPPQNQPNNAYTFSIPVQVASNPQTANVLSAASSSFPEYPAYVQAIPSNVYQPQLSDSFSNQFFSVEPAPNQQMNSMQNPIVLVPVAQQNTAQSQPIVLTFQPPQTQTAQNQQSSQPIVCTMQTQPTSPNQNQQTNSKQQQGTNAAPKDNQSLMAYVMSQMQNPQGSANPLAAILPAMLNSKSEKSSSMKALLPFIFNMLNERRSGCVCPNCGCNTNNQNMQEPLVNTGYAKEKNYSLLEPMNKESNKDDEVNTSEVEIKNKKSKPKKSNNVVQKKSYKENEITNQSAELSEEEDDDEEEISEENDDDE